MFYVFLSLIFLPSQTVASSTYIYVFMYTSSSIASLSFIYVVLCCCCGVFHYSYFIFRIFFSYMQVLILSSFFSLYLILYSSILYILHVLYYIKEKPNLCQQFIIDDFIHTLDSSLHHLLLILLVRLIIIVIIAVVIIITFKIVVAGWDTDAELNAECLKCLKDFVIIIIFLCCRCTNSIRSNCGGIEKYTNTSMHKD